MPTISRAEAQEPFVLTLDVGSSSVRVGLFDALGRVVVGREVQIEYKAQTTHDGGAFFDAAMLIQTVTDGVDKALHVIGDDAKKVAAVAMDTFWHSLVGVDAAGKALTPVLTWADTRSDADAHALLKEVDAEAVHQRTGSRIHTTYFPAKLRWLARTQSATFKAVHMWLSFGEYLYLHLFGTPRTSVSMASGTGLLVQGTCEWDAEMLKVSGISANQLASLDEADTPVKGLKGDYATRWPALADVAWYPAYGDGATSNVGSGCYDPARIAVNIGTSGAMRVAWERESIRVPEGLWCYRIDRKRLLVGGALSSGGNHYAWLRNTLQLANSSESEEATLAQMPPDAHGLTFLPFLAGERAPGYAASARATISGLDLDTTPHDILRAALEAIAYRFQAVYAELCTVVPDSHDMVVSGNAILRSATWQHILADVLNCPIQPSCEAEATSRGAALLVLEALGALKTLADAPFEFAETLAPDSAATAVYAKAIVRQQHLYDLLVKPGA